MVQTQIILVQPLCCLAPYVLAHLRMYEVRDSRHGQSITALLPLNPLASLTHNVLGNHYCSRFFLFSSLSSSLSLKLGYFPLSYNYIIGITQQRKYTVFLQLSQKSFAQ